jgi:ABC-type Na+ transport system ATPase subunit NatA
VDQLCDSVVIIHEGKLCFEGGVDAMRSQTGEMFLNKAFLRLIKPKIEGATT